MKDLTIECASHARDSTTLIDLSGYAHFVSVQVNSEQIDANAHLNAYGAAAAATWLLGWLAEHAPEERTKVLREAGVPDTADGTVKAPDPNASREGCLGDYYEAEVRKLHPRLPERPTPGDVYVAIRTLAEARDKLMSERDAARGELRLVSAVASGLPLDEMAHTPLTRKVAQLRGELEERRIEGARYHAEVERLRTELAAVPAQREAAAIATWAGIRAMFEGCEVTIKVPSEVSRG